MAHWADGDLLVGNTLLDIKTVTNIRDPDKIVSWLQQLLTPGSTSPTATRFAKSGSNLARYGQLLTWALDEFAAALLQTPTQTRS